MAEPKRARRRRSAFANRLVIMAKSPRAGQVKRRLGAGLGPVAACQIYRACLAHTLRRLGADPRWHTTLAVTPDTRCDGGILAACRGKPRRCAPWPRGGRSWPAHAAPLRAPAAGTRHPCRHRHRFLAPLPHRPRFSPARRQRRRARARPRRRLLAHRAEALPASARTLQRRALVEPARSRRHARQSQGPPRRLMPRRCPISTRRPTFAPRAPPSAALILPPRQ